MEIADAFRAARQRLVEAEVALAEKSALPIPKKITEISACDDIRYEIRQIASACDMPVNLSMGMSLDQQLAEVDRLISEAN